jgi:hypothetical protein
LGRFGLGLKTASFSQCRNLTVATKENNNDIIYRCWNLDYVTKTGEWKLLNYLNDKKFTKRLSNIKSGTVVIWENIDRLVVSTSEENEDDLNNFLDKINLLQQHLQMVFHIYLETQILNIWIKDRKLEAWDPYLKKNKDTKAQKQIKLRDGITVRPFILPHHSKLEHETFESASGIKGWNAQQGFYIYRNERLIIAGEWLGLYKQDEHYKLARIMVNIPNTVTSDQDWHLDIKKSTATPPYDIRQVLKEIADKARKEAVEIYRQIGKSNRGNSNKEDIPVWNNHLRNGKRCYQINRDHPVIKAFIETPTEKKGKVQRVLRLIEETVPLPMIILNESENQDIQNVPFEGKTLSDLVNMIVELYHLLLEKGMSKEEAIEEILRTEPFNHYPELAANIEFEEKIIES